MSCNTGLMLNICTRLVRLNHIFSTYIAGFSLMLDDPILGTFFHTQSRRDRGCFGFFRRDVKLQLDCY